MRWFLAVLLMVGLSMPAFAQFEFPPVRYSGQLLSSYRYRQPSEGEDSLQIANTAEIIGDSYIWKPWFGLWRARGALSRVSNDADSETTANLVGAELTANLFHRSHFPLNAFLLLQESSVDLDDDELQETINDVQLLRVGATQQYQPLEGDQFYSASIEHNVQRDRTSESRDTFSLLQLTGQRRWVEHSLAGVFNLNRFTNSVVDGESLLGQFTLSHDYRPSSYLSMNNNAFMVLSEGSTNLDETEAQSLGLSSQTNWRHRTMPLTARGEVSYAKDKSSSLLGSDRDRDRVRLRGGTRYEFSDQLSVAADAGYEQRFGAEDLTDSFQTLSAIYNSLPIPWREYQYSYNGSIGLGARQATDDEGAETASLNVGHALNRNWVVGDETPVALIFNAGQELRVEADSKDGQLNQLFHRATLAASYASQSGNAYTQLSTFDVRSSGRDDTHFFLVDLVGTFQHTLTRYRNVNATLTLHHSSVERDAERVVNDGATAEVFYRDSRLFSVRRLRFETRLRSQSESLSWFDVSGETGELSWENRLDYSIGLLEVRIRTIFTRASDTSDAIYALSIARRF